MDGFDWAWKLVAAVVAACGVVISAMQLLLMWTKHYYEQKKNEADVRRAELKQNHEKDMAKKLLELEEKKLHLEKRRQEYEQRKQLYPDRKEVFDYCQKLIRYGCGIPSERRSSPRECELEWREYMNTISSMQHMAKMFISGNDVYELLEEAYAFLQPYDKFSLKMKKLEAETGKNYFQILESNEYESLKSELKKLEDKTRYLHNEKIYEVFNKYLRY